MGVILPFRPNKLAFSGGLPGINPVHPAAQNLTFSAIISNAGAVAGAINLTNGSSCNTSAGSILPTPVMDAAIGPSFSTTAGGCRGFALTTAVATPTAGTFAVIVRQLGAPSSTYGSLISTHADGCLFFTQGGASPNMDIYTAGDNKSSFTLTTGTPYFLVYSGSLVAGGIGYHVATNLRTGQVFTSKITIGTTYAGTGGTILNVGADGSNNSNTNLAAAMYSANMSLPLGQLLQWANDPWSFWYPQKLDLGNMLVPTQVPPPVVVASDVAGYAQNSW